MRFLIGIFLCFALVPKLVPRTVDFTGIGTEYWNFGTVTTLVGRVVPMIRSAVRTTLRSLLRSDLVAELNQTVIDVQRTDSMMAE